MQRFQLAPMPGVKYSWIPDRGVHSQCEVLTHPQKCKRGRGRKTRFAQRKPDTCRESQSAMSDEKSSATTRVRFPKGRAAAGPDNAIASCADIYGRQNSDFRILRRRIDRPAVPPVGDHRVDAAVRVYACESRRQSVKPGDASRLSRIDRAQSVRQHRTRLSETIFPIIGAAIGRACARLLARMMQRPTQWSMRFSLRAKVAFGSACYRQTI